MDSANNIYILGQCTGNGFKTVKYDANGTEQWVKQFGSGCDRATSIVIDNADNTSSPITDVLAVYTNANGYVTGHAKTLPTTTDSLPIARDTSNNPAKLVIGFTNVTSPTSGSFDINYIIKQNKDEFSLSSNSVNYVVVLDSTHASILGHANLVKYINGVQTTVSNVAVKFDITLGTDGNPDHITVRIFNPGVTPNNGNEAYLITDDIIAQGSNLMIHP